MNFAYLYKTKIGSVLIVEDGVGITQVALADEVTDDKMKNQFVVRETDHLKEAAKQLNEYLEGIRKEFKLQLNPRGTQFQQKVWEALINIPYGETRSYKQVAEAIGNPKAYRAVGMANHNNPIMCIVPCHRVIGADKSLVGYAGGLHIKEQLLNLEKESERNSKNE